MDNGNHDIHVDHNNIYNVDHGLITSSGTAGGSFGPIWFNNNHVHDFANWDTDSNSYHHDGIHCYTVAGGQPMHITDFYIYDNRFDGSIGDNATSWIFMEDSSGSSATPCADASSKIWLFNNVGIASRDLGNGVFGMFSGRTFAYQNTIIGDSSEPGSVGLQHGRRLRRSRRLAEQRVLERQHVALRRPGDVPRRRDRQQRLRRRQSQRQRVVLQRLRRRGRPVALVRRR